MNTVITIGRQYGSGGRELGQILAKRLGFEFYDEELVTMAAEKNKIGRGAGKTGVFLRQSAAGSFTFAGAVVK